ncbi:unnamed protein product [Arabidopsis halleri]
MASKSAVDIIESSSKVHFSGFHQMDGLVSTRPEQMAEEEEHGQPFVIGVAGGAASGKTTVCDMIMQQLHDQRAVVVNQDSFYHNVNEEELVRVHDYNFDHPDAFDTEQLLSSMEKLRKGQAVDIPNYDFKSYKNNVFPPRRVNPSDVIILEGILIFHDPRVRDLMNMKIFVDADADVRLARRIKSDTVEKDRDIATVLDQYSKFVKPAFEDFILPTKKYADIIIPRGGDNHVAIDLIVQHIRTKLGQHDLCKIYPNLYVIQSTFQIRGMHTLIRDSNTTKHDFIFYSDRLIRLVVEHGLGHLPFTEKQVVTPTGSVYSGVDFCKKLCGVSVIRSGESMENALRACCKGIKIGKILIHREGDNGQQLIYEKLPSDISERHVLLLDPILGTGNSAVQAIRLLISKGVPESNIIFLNLISAPQGVNVVCKRFPRIKIVTSEIELGLNDEFRVVPGMGEVSIPYRLRKTLQNIREITGKQHSDEDIFAVYKDSFNDPHETAQKLLFLDTFHEVRSKREKKKEASTIVPVTQASGRGGRRNFASSNSYQGSNGRNASFKRENGGNHVTRVSRTALPVTNKASNNNIAAPSEIKVSGPTSLPSEVSNHNKVQDDPSLISASRCSSQSDQATEIETASKQGKTQSLPKSDVSQQSHVTFPFHLQVAKGLQNGLTFGSFDSNFVKEVSSNNGASGGDDSNFESSDGTGDGEREPSPTTNGIPGVASAREEASTFSEVKDYGISNSAPGAEPVVHSDHIVPPVEEVLKEEALSNTETHQIAPLSVFGLVPSLSAIGQPVNTEAAETQPGNSNSPAISLVSYPPDQSSIAAASQQANFLRQQYPPNFFPYGPYYSPYYMPPPYIHQFLSPNGIPQQSFFPPGAALTAPSHVNPVGNTENPPTTNPYLHTSPMVASSIPSATAFNSIHSEEKASPQTESAATWIGQGFGNLQVNPMYNLAFQGQPLGFPVVQAGHGGLMGIHQPTQPMAAASTTYQTLPPPPPPHTTTAMGEPIGHPHIAYQQPQATLTNWVNNY